MRKNFFLVFSIGFVMAGLSNTAKAQGSETSLWDEAFPHGFHTAEDGSKQALLGSAEVFLGSALAVEIDPNDTKLASLRNQMVERIAKREAERVVGHSREHLENLINTRAREIAHARNVQIADRAYYNPQGGINPRAWSTADYQLLMLRGEAVIASYEQELAANRRKLAEFDGHVAEFTRRINAGRLRFVSPAQYERLSAAQRARAVALSPEDIDDLHWARFSKGAAHVGRILSALYAVNGVVRFGAALSGRDAGDLPLVNMVSTLAKRAERDAPRTADPGQSAIQGK